MIVRKLFMGYTRYGGKSTFLISVNVSMTRRNRREKTTRLTNTVQIVSTEEMTAQNFTN